MTLYYTDTLEHATSTTPVVTPDGDLILAGGILGDNYKPLASVWCYHFGTQEPAANGGLASARGLWPWAIVAMIAAIVAIAYLLSIGRRKKPVDVNVQPPADDIDDVTLADGKGEELMERICQLMDDEQLYLRSDLKLQDVAVRLSTNSSYISECINSVRSQSFSLFINTYRIRHAQELLRKQPDIKTATLAEESGFSTETTFFRNFKIVTGMTPREWLTTLAQGQQ
jgi:AraC-like DNA-binding protein